MDRPPTDRHAPRRPASPRRHGTDGRPEPPPPPGPEDLAHHDRIGLLALRARALDDLLRRDLSLRHLAGRSALVLLLCVGWLLMMGGLDDLRRDAGHETRGAVALTTGLLALGGSTAVLVHGMLLRRELHRLLYAWARLPPDRAGPPDRANQADRPDQPHRYPSANRLSVPPGRTDSALPGPRTTTPSGASSHGTRAAAVPTPGVEAAAVPRPSALLSRRLSWGGTACCAILLGLILAGYGGGSADGEPSLVFTFVLWGALCTAAGVRGLWKALRLWRTLAAVEDEAEAELHAWAECADSPGAAARPGRSTTAARSTPAAPGTRHLVPKPARGAGRGAHPGTASLTDPGTLFARLNRIVPTSAMAVGGTLLSLLTALLLGRLITGSLWPLGGLLAGCLTFFLLGYDYRMRFAMAALITSAALGATGYLAHRDTVLDARGEWVDAVVVDVRHPARSSRICEVEYPEGHRLPRPVSSCSGYEVGEPIRVLIDPENEVAPSLSEPRVAMHRTLTYGAGSLFTVFTAGGLVIAHRNRRRLPAPVRVTDPPRPV